MNKSDQKLYIEEMEIKPNRYASLVLCFTLFVILICWILNEVGIFRVGTTDMRVGAIVTSICLLVPIVILFSNKKNLSNPRTKYIVISAAAVFTFTEGTLLTFHTTIMLLFPILFAMLYRSKTLGVVATVSSFVCTIFTPVVAYLLGTWDVPLFQELILIATDGGVCDIVGGTGIHNWTSVIKILLYIVFPRLLLVGSCAILMFYNISIGVDHVNNQVLLDRISHIDSLTDMYNQNYLKDITKEIREREKEDKIGILFFDVNNLKVVNDSRGHEIGNILLKSCADSISTICNDESIMGFRAGGDEFLVIVEGATESILNQMISKWEDRLAEINNSNKLMREDLYCSMAVGMAIGKSSEIDSVINLADSFMYRNKARMKNENK